MKDNHSFTGLGGDGSSRVLVILVDGSGLGRNELKIQQVLMRYACGCHPKKLVLCYKLIRAQACG